MERAPILSAHDLLHVHRSAAGLERLPDELSNLLVAQLSCNGAVAASSTEAEASASPFELLSSLCAHARTGRPRRCGYIFKAGDIAWHCRTCQADDTCVLCQQCFSRADHHGHDLHFYRSGGAGGCCDCGDAEAFKLEVRTL
eukprot:6196716-Pleurochrysis_carterae.AAC.2